MGFSWQGILETKKGLINMKKKIITVSFNAPSLQMQSHKKSLLDLTSQIIKGGIFLFGQQTEELEKRLTGLFNRNAVTVASGHDALLLSLQSLKLSSNDEVIIPANAYPTAFPIYLSGVTPVLCDVDENGQLDPNAVKKVLSSKTK